MKVMPTHSPLRILLCLVVACISPAHAAAEACGPNASPCVHLRGAVTHGNTAVGGAQIVATEQASGIRFSTFSGPAGNYRLLLAGGGAYEVGAVFGKFAAPPQTLTAHSDGELSHDIILADDPDFMARVPSASWLALLPEGDMKREFLLNCTSCHELDQARLLVDGKVRTAAQWTEAFALMRAIDQYELLPPDFADAAYVEWLTANLTREAIARLTPPVPANVARLAGVRIT